MTADPLSEPPARASRAGRNLPVAVGIGLLLLLVVGASLGYRPEPFVGLAAVAVGGALWEIRQAFTRREVRVPIVPLVVGSTGILVSAFVSGPEALMVAFLLTVAGCVVWRLVDGGGPAAVRDAAATTFAVAYLPFLAGFVMLMLAQDDGRMRVLLFILLAVANDVGGYVAGVLFGRHPLAPTVSPKKSWEGLAGSFVLATAVGVVGVVWGLGADPWLGIALGILAPLTATVGDLAESLLKRDLELKDMGSLLPGHGGILDRIDSMLLTAPFVYLMLTVAL
ncbi:phosphatidate cytidylyltransferase [Paraoerskovia sediminicola]|uniref:Phosphatidate cytidylyltransferase n=1 Tax=Paraoerskovia sediminicola TaxID=1138587 RepID=A0ABM8G765_9CELL|nr:phosphatidate cytidylyltransferase [Paraoerskovia sediminicola]BDZ43932.1 phosphatidate cytidylyltransferase [Paraoerskovia sediminicola]